MQIQSRAERDFWTKSLITIVPDALIGIGIAYFTSANVIFAVIGTVIGLQILYLVIQIKTVAWNWVVYRLSGDRKKLREAAFDFLQKNRFPEPPEYLHDVDYYFKSVMGNARLPCDQRIKAAIELTMAECMAKFQGKLRVMMAWEVAIEKYKSTFPPSREEPDYSQNSTS